MAHFIRCHDNESAIIICLFRRCEFNSEKDLGNERIASKRDGKTFFVRCNALLETVWRLALPVVFVTTKIVIFRTCKTIEGRLGYFDKSG